MTDIKNEEYHINHMDIKDQYRFNFICMSYSSCVVLYYTPVNVLHSIVLYCIKLYCITFIKYNKSSIIILDHLSLNNIIFYLPKYSVIAFTAIICLVLSCLKSNGTKVSPNVATLRMRSTR